MTEFLNWLSAHPTASVFIGLIASILVAICVVAFFQRREITFWPPKISARPEAFKRMVQLGDVHLPKDKPKEFYDSLHKGRRGIHVPVRFEFPFKRCVSVTVSLQMIDVGDGVSPGINRVLVAAANVKSSGFDVYFETWEDSRLRDAATSWIAVGE
ncbi:MAG TPA: H-type lectin domain-containing protein [Blastocatellia bacterium]|nr:H-type lectin domain-containing protein [Blastocatellia bacterium]